MTSGVLRVACQCSRGNSGSQRVATLRAAGYLLAAHRPAVHAEPAALSIALLLEKQLITYGLQRTGWGIC